jgi:hypothetical protein
MRWKGVTAAAALAVAALTAGCTSGSPTKATTDTTPNFQGQYTGSSSVAGCTEDGGFAGFCQGVGFTSGATFSTSLNLTQSQNAVTGTIALLGLTGTLQGTASGSSGLTATGTLSDVTDSGVTLSSSIASWSTMLNGNALSGSYKIVFHTNATSGSATVNANIVQLSR